MCKYLSVYLQMQKCVYAEVRCIGFEGQSLNLNSILPDFICSPHPYLIGMNGRVNSLLSICTVIDSVYPASRPKSAGIALVHTNPT